MSIASSSLDLIRRVFRRDQMIVPGAPDIYNTMDFTSNQSLGGMQLSANGPQSEGSGYLSESVAVDQDLTSRYQDYEEMDSYPEIAAALDIFADDATVQDTLNGRSLWFEAPDNVIQEILENMVTKQLRLEDGLWERARTIAKWGNCFEEIICIDQVGVVDLKDLPVPTCRRIQDPHGLLYGFVQDPSLGFTVSTEMFLQRIQAKSSVSNYLDQSGMHSYDDLVQVFEPWELVHYRMQGRNSSDAYGISMADASRYAWRRLTMMEDSMILYKITRSPSRFAFYCDVGDAPPNQVKKLLNQVKQDFRKQRYTDASGKLLTRFNPLAADEDFFLPVRKGNKGTEVEVLAGPEGQQIDDVNYFKDKLIASLKMPKSYLGADDTVGRANLSQLDIRLCRTVMRLQRVIKNGMMQVARVDLSAKNIDPDLVEFSCYMNIPSGALELAQLEVLNAKLDLADKYQRANFPEYYVWSAVLGLSDDEISMYKSIRDQERGAGGATESKIGVYSTEKMIDEAKKDQRAQEQIKRVLDEVALGRSDFSRRMKELKGLVSDVRYSVSRDIKSRRKK